MVSPLGLALLVAITACTGYWLLFTTFMAYDDEGYVLLSLRNFSLHGGLYDRVYSQYGPFPYLLYDGLHRLLGFEFTNTAGRWITLVNWTGAAAACAALVGRRTRSAIWAAFTFAGVFTYLWVMINEPVHPGGLITLLVAAGTWFCAEAWRAGRPDRFALIAGAVGAALALTKINVGVFFLGSAFAWLALNTRPAGAARTLTWLVATGCSALPFVLMRSLWASAWVPTFALVFVGSALGLLLAGRTAAAPVAGRAVWIRFAAAAAAVGALVVGLALARGTTPTGLLHGVLLEPLKHPGVYYFAMNWRVGTATLALALLGAAGFATRPGVTDHPAFRHAIAAGRLVAAIAFLASPLKLIPTSLAAWGMCYGVTLAWLFVPRLHDQDENAPVRAWVALVLVFQFLHAYPVAGSQINWGTYLFVPLLALGVHGAAPVYAGWLGPRLRLLRPIGAGFILLVSLIMINELSSIGRARYFSPDPQLGLPGAENIRLSADMVTTLQVLDENLVAHAATVFSLPGLYSINLWSGRPTPTLTNATHWFSILSEDRQQETIRQLEADPRAAVVYQKDVIDYLARTGFPIGGALHAWLEANFTPAFAIDGYEMRVRRGRRIAPLSTAQFAIEGETVRFTLVFRVPAQPVAAVELRSLFAPNQVLLRLTPGDARFQSEAIDLAGTATGTATAAGGILRLGLEFPSRRLPFAARNTILIVPVDAAGHGLARIRLVN